MKFHSEFRNGGWVSQVNSIIVLIKALPCHVTFVCVPESDPLPRTLPAHPLNPPESPRVNCANYSRNGVG